VRQRSAEIGDDDGDRAVGGAYGEHSVVEERNRCTGSGSVPAFVRVRQFDACGQTQAQREGTTAAMRLLVIPSHA
jgi:hypothetical protein